MLRGLIAEFRSADETSCPQCGKEADTFKMNEGIRCAECIVEWIRQELAEILKAGKPADQQRAIQEYTEQEKKWELEFLKKKITRIENELDRSKEE